jgi:hypothetical protein
MANRREFLRFGTVTLAAGVAADDLSAQTPVGLGKPPSPAVAGQVTGLYKKLADGMAQGNADMVASTAATTFQASSLTGKQGVKDTWVADLKKDMAAAQFKDVHISVDKISVEGDNVVVNLTKRFTAVTNDGQHFQNEAATREVLSPVGGELKVKSIDIVKRRFSVNGEPVSVDVHKTNAAMLQGCGDLSTGH